MPIKSNVTDKRPRAEKFKQVIKLVSGGFAHPEAFPNGEITVLPWDSTIDAWLGTVASSANTQGLRDRVMFDLLAKVCVLGPCPVEDFVLGDMNTVLMVSRAISNLNKIQYTTSCPECGIRETDEIAVPGDLRPIGQKEPGYKGVDEVVLEMSQDKVLTRPLRVRDSLEVMRRSKEGKAKVPNNIALIVQGVVSVNGTATDHIQELLEWYFSLHPRDATQLEKFQDEQTPHLSQDIYQQCPSCGAIYDFKLPLDFNFFRTGRVGAAIPPVDANL